MTSERRALIASRIRYFREQRGWTAYRLAKEADMNRGYVQALEAGRHGVTDEKLEDIARALDVTLSDLNGEAERIRGFHSALAELETRGLRIPHRYTNALQDQMQWRESEIRSQEEWKQAYLDVLPEIWEHIRPSEE